MIVVAWILAVCFIVASGVSLFFGMKTLFNNANHGEWESVFQAVYGFALVLCSVVCGVTSSILFWLVTR